MIQKDFEAITVDDINGLITNGVHEYKTLDYKKTLPGRTEADKKEFLADACSFANASGGDIVYGVEAAVDENGKPTGAPKSLAPIAGQNSDEAKLWMEQTLRSGIAPRLRCQIKDIHLTEEHAGFLIVLRIARSIAAPHMVTYKGSSRFYSRNSAGKFQLDVDEIRSAFLATEQQAERIKCFREERLGRILADETPVPLSAPHRLVLHVIPITSFLKRDRIDLSAAVTLERHFRTLTGGSTKSRHNLEGFLTSEALGGPNEPAEGYCQVFFDGTIEAVSADSFTYVQLVEDEPRALAIPSIAYERYVIKAVERYMAGLSWLGLTPPVAISLSLLGCKGAIMYADERTLQRLGAMGRPHGIDRACVTTPDVVVPDLTIDVPKALQPVFDAVWNACGFARSQNYDNEGNWIQR